MAECFEKRLESRPYLRFVLKLEPLNYYFDESRDNNLPALDFSVISRAPVEEIDGCICSNINDAISSW